MPSFVLLNQNTTIISTTYFASFQIHSIFLLRASLNTVVLSMCIEWLALRKAGAILLYNSSTSTSKEGKEHCEFNIITKKTNKWNTLFCMNLNQLSRKCVI